MPTGARKASHRLHPQPVFLLLGVGVKEASIPQGPKDITGGRLAAENWLIDHGKYRVTRFVADMPPK